MRPKIAGPQRLAEPGAVLGPQAESDGCKKGTHPQMRETRFLVVF